MPCPHCGYRRCWRIRRGHVRCKRCRTEWSSRHWIVPGLRYSEADWRTLLDAFLRDRTRSAIARETGLKLRRLQAALTVLRQALALEAHGRFRGPVEVDDCFLGPRWHNRRPWQRFTKRGRGTDQQPVFGVFDRPTGTVAAVVIPRVRWPHIAPLLRAWIQDGANVYSDTYSAYRPLRRAGYRHQVVDHGRHEYARGCVSVNHVESFWGYVKRRFKVTGGLRRHRLPLYLAEWVWRYNHRTLSREAQVKRLIEMLKEQSIGGKTCT